MNIAEIMEHLKKGDWVNGELASLEIGIDTNFSIDDLKSLGNFILEELNKAISIEQLYSMYWIIPGIGGGCTDSLKDIEFRDIFEKIESHQKMCIVYDILNTIHESYFFNRTEFCGEKIEPNLDATTLRVLKAFKSLL